MKSVDLIERAGDDGVLRLNIPVEEPGREYHVIVHLEPDAATNDKAKTGLPPDFVEETAGKWIGEFPIDSEGDYEERLPL